MAAGPRDTPQGRDTAQSGAYGETRGAYTAPGARGAGEALDAQESDGSEEPGDELGALGPGESLESLQQLEPLDAPEFSDSFGTSDPGAGGGDGEPDLPPGPASFRELRPQRRLRIWQLAPITALAVGGSLMFAFPLAFESGDAGPVVAMLGLLLCCCAAGWGLTAARRLGQTWPGLPPRGSAARPDWRFVAGYTVIIGLLAVLAVWRVARLR
jgi:hypothetical protein